MGTPWPEEEVTQRLDLALERLRGANERQHRARERLLSECPPPGDGDEENASPECVIAAGGRPAVKVG